MALEKSVYSVQSVNKALDILDYISNNPCDSTLQVITSKVALTRNKTFRLLETLCERGLVELEKSSGKYCLGGNSFSLAQKLLKNSSIVNITHPVIERLALRHEETVYMATINGDDVLFMDMADCNQQIKVVPFIGKTFPFFTNAAGKVMKALGSAEFIDWLSKIKFKNIKNIPDPAALAVELLEIRSNGGIAVDARGLGDEVTSIAVAVRDYTGHIIGAITMLVPSFRHTRERIENEIIPSLVEEAASVSKMFGFIPT